MKFYIILVVIFGVLTLVSSQNEGQVYCGRRLSMALDWFCNGSLFKRSVRNNDGISGWPWITSERAYKLNRFKRNGIVSECCEKPCTINELLSYCAPNS